MEKVTMVQGWETGAYNPDTCRNGGGYWQYSGWAAFSDGWAVELQDTSCGDFGTRCHAQLHAPDGRCYCVCYGTMEDDAAIDNADADAVAAAILGRYGADMAEIINTADDAIRAAALML